MNWLAGIERNREGQLCGRTQDVDGSSSHHSIESFNASIDQGVETSFEVDLNLQSLRYGDTQTFLNDLYLNDLEAGAQPVYEIVLATGTLVIPSQLLIVAILGSVLRMRQWLFRPWSFGQFLHIHIEDGIPTLNPMNGENHCSYRSSVPYDRLRRVEWILTYPSARIAWGSVYRNALNGRFEMTLPNAVVGLLVGARQVNDRFLATRLVLQRLSPRERRHEFASAVF